MRNLIIIVITLLISSAQGKVLVLEYLDDPNDLSHGESVTSIACPLVLENCVTVYSNDFSRESLNILFDEKQEGFNSVNMSFGWQKPIPLHDTQMGAYNENYAEIQAKYDKSLEEFEKGIPTIREMITTNSDLLFVAAAGNGVSLGIFQSAGVALSNRAKLYPSFMEYPNLIKVASITLDQVDPANVEEYSIADYSNYGLLLTEVAAPVEPDFTGELLRGTSFAAPFISRISDKIMDKHPNVTPENVKEILTKSCHVKNIDAAIAASIDLNQKAKESDVYKAMFERNVKVREELQLKIGDIILVKCGGVVLKEVAMACAENVSTANGDISSACLKAHQDIRSLDDEGLSKLEQLWDVREI